MKKIFLLISIFTLFLVGCGSESDTTNIVTNPVEPPLVHKNATVITGADEKINYVNWYKVYTTSGNSIVVDTSSDQHESFSSGIIAQNIYITNNSDFDITKLQFIGTGYTLNSITDSKLINILDNRLNNSGFSVNLTIPKGKTYGTFLNFISVFGGHLTSTTQEDNLINEVLNTDFSKITVPVSNINYALESEIINLDKLTYGVFADINSYEYAITITYSNGEKETLTKSLDYSASHKIKVVDKEYSFNPTTKDYSEFLNESVWSEDITR